LKDKRYNFQMYTLFILMWPWMHVRITHCLTQ
jgi:hypothetical protein